MYGRTSGNRPLYVCGRYMKHGPTACNNNAVDAEALLTMVVRYVERFSRFPAIEDRLRALMAAKLKAAALADSTPVVQSNDTALRQERQKLIEEAAILVQNMRRVKSATLITELEAEYERLQAELAEVESDLAQSAPPVESLILPPEEQIEEALKLLRNFRRIVTDPAAKSELPNVVAQLGVRVGLVFQGGTKGRKRPVRILKGGLVVFRNAELPVDLHGRDRVDQQACSDRITPPAATLAADGQIRLSTGEIMAMQDPEHRCDEAKGTEVPPAIVSGIELRPKEGISSTKVSRGDRS